MRVFSALVAVFRAVGGSLLCLASSRKHCVVREIRCGIMDASVVAVVSEIQRALSLLKVHL